MLKFFPSKLIALTAILAAGLSLSNAASAADLGLIAAPESVGRCSDIVFQCENGRTYPLCPIAISVAGEVITATLRGSYVRLVPMGVGYRYAGKGIWLDGLRENAILNIGKHDAVACSIVQ
jgi:hypothetical protein